MDTLVHSYLFLRRAVGLIGLALPPVLILGELIFGDGRVLDSISGYRHSDLRDVYVGALFAIGVFLLSYRGYGKVDDVTGNIAAAGAIGAALFPNSPPGETTRTQDIINVVHLGFSGMFFLALAFFCLFLFTRTNQARPTYRKLMRNNIYRASGIVILVSLALIVLLGFVFEQQFGALHPVLWLESIATLAFGTAWLTKGDTIMRDLLPPPRPIPRPRRWRISVRG